MKTERIPMERVHVISYGMYLILGKRFGSLYKAPLYLMDDPPVKQSGSGEKSFSMEA